MGEGGGFEVDGAGGFEVAGGAGGFMEIDDGGGGFMDDGGGFQPEPQPEPTPADDAYAQPSPSTGIPLSKLPPLLAALGLPVDNDVLEVFRASASGWDFDVDTPDRRRKRDDGEPGVERKDFRAVCAALMGPDEDGDASGSDEEGQGGEGDEGGEDVYHLPSEDESSLSDLSSDGARSPGPSRRTRKALESNSTLKLKLDTRQREIARDIWEMLKPDVKEGKRGSSIMGRDEVRQWVRTLGEMWTEDEVSVLVERETWGS